MNKKTSMPGSFLSPRLLLVAVNSLSLLRLPGGAARGAEELGGAVGFFPLVGALMGAVLVGVRAGLAQVFPEPVMAALTLAAWVLMSGALHLDGFLDACDGLFGGNTPTQRLKIMRDEAIGAFAFAGGALLMLTKFTVLQGTGAAGLFLAPVLGRWAMAASVVVYPYARKEGLGSAMKANAGGEQLFLSSILALAAAWLAGGWTGLVAMAATGILIALLGRLALKRVPGYTGDLYGATCETGEALVLLVFVALGG